MCKCNNLFLYLKYLKASLDLFNRTSNNHLRLLYVISMCVFVVCSFHVGSGAQSSTAYANALSLAKDVFVTAVSHGIGHIWKMKNVQC